MLRYLVLCLAACSASTSTPPAAKVSTPTPPPPATVPAAKVVPFARGELTFSVMFHKRDHERRDIARLHPDGTLELDRHRGDGLQPVASIAEDGTLTVSGNQVVRRGEDRRFYASDGTPVFELEGDALVLDGLRVTLDEAGVFVGMPDETQVSGASDPALRRTALLVLGHLIELAAEPGTHGLRVRKDPIQVPTSMP